MAALKISRAARGHGLLRSLKLVYAAIESIAATKKYSIDVQIPQADLIANVLQNIVVPHAGFVTGLDTIVQLAITTGGTIKIQLNGVDVTGALVTIANADAIGTRKTSSPTATAVVKGDRLTLVLAGFATAGAVNAHIGMLAD